MKARTARVRIAVTIATLLVAAIPGAASAKTKTFTSGPVPAAPLPDGRVLVAGGFNTLPGEAQPAPTGQGAAVMFRSC